jgi:hypothetical protein
MKSKHLFLCGFLILNVFLTSCEGNTDRIRIIENQTSGSVNVTATGSLVSTFDKRLSMGQSETLYLGGQMGGSDMVENPADGISTLLIINTNGDTCSKDFTIQSNWDIQVEQTKKTPSNWKHEYTFIVRDSDF